MIRPGEFAKGLAAMIHDAETRGGGRYTCCGRGQCALHLAEEHPDGGTYSTHPAEYPNHYVLAHTWNHDGQQLTAAFSRATLDHAARNLFARSAAGVAS